MTSAERSRIRVADPGDLVEVIPYLLGFHPSESLVLLGFGPPRSGNRQVDLAVRSDLPPHPLADGEFEGLRTALRNSQVREVAVVWVSDTFTGPAAPGLIKLSRGLREHFAAAGLVMVEELLATSTQWWALDGRDRRRSRPEGTPRTFGGATSAASAVFAGLVARPDRAHLEQSLDGDTAERRAGLLPAIEEAQAVLERARGRERDGLLGAHLDGFSAAARLLSRGGPTVDLPPADLAGLAVALGVLSIRDELWLRIDEGSLDADALLRVLQARLPRPYDAPALFLLGWSRWRQGDGALAAMAAERTLVSQPCYSAAELLLVTVGQGLNPYRTPALRP